MSRFLDGQREDARAGTDAHMVVEVLNAETFAVRTGERDGAGRFSSVGGAGEGGGDGEKAGNSCDALGQGCSSSKG